MYGWIGTRRIRWGQPKCMHPIRDIFTLFLKIIWNYFDNILFHFHLFQSLHHKVDFFSTSWLCDEAYSLGSEHASMRASMRSTSALLKKKEKPLDSFWFVKWWKYSKLWDFNFIYDTFVLATEHIHMHIAHSFGLSHIYKPELCVNWRRRPNQPFTCCFAVQNVCALIRLGKKTSE